MRILYQLFDMSTKRIIKSFKKRERLTPHIRTWIRQVVRAHVGQDTRCHSLRISILEMLVGIGQVIPVRHARHIRLDCRWRISIQISWIVIGTILMVMTRFGILPCQRGLVCILPLRLLNTAVDQVFNRRSRHGNELWVWISWFNRTLGSAT